MEIKKSPKYLLAPSFFWFTGKELSGKYFERAWGFLWVCRDIRSSVTVLNAQETAVSLLPQNAAECTKTNLSTSLVCKDSFKAEPSAELVKSSPKLDVKLISYTHGQLQPHRWNQNDLKYDILCNNANAFIQAITKVIKSCFSSLFCVCSPTDKCTSRSQAQVDKHFQALLEHFSSSTVLLCTYQCNCSIGLHLGEFCLEGF